MKLDQNTYFNEMHLLIERATKQWSTAARPPIYSLNVWTDPQAQLSAVNIDTRVNSDNQIQQIRTFMEAKKKRALSIKDKNLIDITNEALRSLPERNDNPAGFVFRCISDSLHKSFDIEWSNSVRCWDELEPCLLKVRDMTLDAFSAFEFDRDAEVSVNSRSSWYDLPRPLRTP